jgi:hypothetical protein
MKTTIYFISSLLVVLLTSFTLTRSTDTVKLGKHYGPVTVDTSLAISPAEMMKKFNKDVTKVEFTISAQIEKVCQSAGCWISIDLGNGQQLRVNFKDHFRIPMKTKIGTKVYFHGVAFWDSVPIDLQRYYARAANESEEEIYKITSPKPEMAFTADGIVLVK